MDELLTDLRVVRSYLKLAEADLERDKTAQSSEWVRNALESVEQMIRAQGSPQGMLVKQHSRHIVNSVGAKIRTCSWRIGLVLQENSRTYIYICI